MELRISSGCLLWIKTCKKKGKEVLIEQRRSGTLMQDQQSPIQKQVGILVMKITHKSCLIWIEIFETLYHLSHSVTRCGLSQGVHKGGDSLQLKQNLQKMTAGDHLQTMLLIAAQLVFLEEGSQQSISMSSINAIFYLQ